MTAPTLAVPTNQVAAAHPSWCQVCMTGDDGRVLGHVRFAAVVLRPGRQRVDENGRTREYVEVWAEQPEQVQVVHPIFINAAGTCVHLTPEEAIHVGEALARLGRAAVGDRR